MGQALYRKYRSRSLDEVIGQEHITDTLKQAIKSGRISHAYLLTGPRGVCKTSVARILAHEINGLPYDDDSSHMDIIEIDAASNRRIDEIRELRDKVYIAPTSAKYKVYIIDEVHMLTKEAFNALLKTLEEPPAHVVFILATTDAHKLPETIVSRTQRFGFKPVEKSKVISHLRDIAKSEKIDVSDEALDLLAEHGEGSFRDSISLLDQASSTGQKLELSDVQLLLGIPPEQSIDNLVSQLYSGSDPASLMQQLDSLYNQGFQPARIAKQISQIVRVKLIHNSIEFDQLTALKLLANLINVPMSADPQRYLEICLLEILPTEPTKTKLALTTDNQIVLSADVEQSPEGSKDESLLKEVQDLKQLDPSVWPNVLVALKQKHNTLYGVVRMAQPSFEVPGIVQLTFSFAFHQKRCNDNGNRQKLSDIILQLTGQVVSIECLLDPSAKPPKIVAEPHNKIPKQDLSAISNIFGSAELLES